MHQVADQSDFKLSFARVPPQVWIKESRLSGPNVGAYEPDPISLIDVFRYIAVPRTDTSQVEQ